MYPFPWEVYTHYKGYLPVKIFPSNHHGRVLESKECIVVCHPPRAFFRQNVKTGFLHTRLVTKIQELSFVVSRSPLFFRNSIWQHLL